MSTPKEFWEVQYHWHANEDPESVGFFLDFDDAVKALNKETRAQIKRCGPCFEGDMFSIHLLIRKFGLRGDTEIHTSAHFIGERKRDGGLAWRLRKHEVIK